MSSLGEVVRRYGAQYLLRFGRAVPLRHKKVLRGPAEDVSVSQPMSLEWTLRAPLPAELFGAFSVLRR